MSLKRKKKQLVAVALAWMLSIGTAVPAATFCAPAVCAAVTPASSDTQNRQTYGTPWATTVNAYLYENDDGTLTRVEYISGKVVVETYDRSFKIQSSKTLSMELSIWGGFYAGEDYNFLIFGQKNTAHSDSTEVIRVVKYSKDWKRLGQASLKGANTAIPFDGGSLRCDELDGMLFVRTCHEMYDGHQSNLTFAVDQDEMTVTDSFYQVANIRNGYVSHSFNQFVLVDSSGRLVAVDHGDSYPRAMVLVRYDNPDSTIRTASGNVNVQTLYGAVGNNYTNAALGGLEETSSGYVTAFHYADENADYREIILAYTSKSDLASKTTKVYASQNTYTPILVSTGMNGGYIMWNCNDTGDTLYYAPYSADGSVGNVQTVKGAMLSSCHPILYNGDIVWYSTHNSAPTFYTFDGSTITATATVSGGSTNTSTGSGTTTTTPETTQYTATFLANGASGTVPKATVTAANRVTMPQPTGLTKSGYTFAGWKNSYNNRIYYAAETVILSGNTTFTAQWTPMATTAKYTAAFDGNDATGTVPTATVSSLNQVVLPSAGSLTKAGYVFSGWKSSADNGTYPVGATANLRQNTTFTAQWTAASLQLDTSSVNLKPGDTYTFLVKNNNDISNITRQIINPGILSVSLLNGSDPRGALYQIEAKAEGSATVNILYKGQTASLKVNISSSGTSSSTTTTTTTNPGKGSIMLDTANYIMAPGNIYDIGITIKDPSGRTLSSAEVQALYKSGKLKVSDSRTGSIANLTQLSNGNFRVTGKNPGTCYIVYDIGGNHASVKIDVQNGVKQHGTAVRNTSYFTQDVF